MGALGSWGIATSGVAVALNLAACGGTAIDVTGSSHGDDAGSHSLTDARASTLEAGATPSADGSGLRDAVGSRPADAGVIRDGSRGARDASGSAEASKDVGPLVPSPCPPGDYFIDVSFEGQPPKRFGFPDRGCGVVGGHAEQQYGFGVTAYAGPPDVSENISLSFYGAVAASEELRVDYGTVSSHYSNVACGTAQAVVHVTAFGAVGEPVEGTFDRTYLGMNCESGINYTVTGGSFRACRCAP